MKMLLIVLTSTIVLVSCNSPKSPGTTSDSKAETSTEAPADPAYALFEAWSTEDVLLTCESVLYHEALQSLFVSCINGAPAEKNGSGFISLLDVDGHIKELEWVTGLNAPKGMGVKGNQLFVTDIDQLVIIDIEKAEIISRIQVEGASFLNDIAIGADGKVYFSDSDTGILSIYSDGQVQPWITEGLERPNGLLVEDTRVLLTSSGSQDLKIIDKTSWEIETVTKEIGHGDGIVFTGDPGHYITSSWAGEVFMIFPDYSKVSLLKTSDREINSADIAFNMDDQIVYVPTFFDNRVVAYKLIKK